MSEIDIPKGEHIQELSASDFRHFVESHGINIGSTLTTSDGVERTVDIRRIANRWVEIRDYLLSLTDMNFVQMIENYKNTNSGGRQSIITNLRHRVNMRFHDSQSEMSDEALMIGLGMILDDVLQIDNSQSLVHVFEKRVEDILNANPKTSRVVVVT